VAIADQSCLLKVAGSYADAGAAHGPSGMVWSRLRIEGLYARTEPWTAVDPGDPLRRA